MVLAARDRGLGPWLEFGDIEDQMRMFQPVAMRKEVPGPMIPFYRLLAAEHGYRVEGAVHGPGAVRMVLLRLPGAVGPRHTVPGRSQAWVNGTGRWRGSLPSGPGAGSRRTWPRGIRPLPSGPTLVPALPE